MMHQWRFAKRGLSDPVPAATDPRTAEGKAIRKAFRAAILSEDGVSLPMEECASHVVRLDGYASPLAAELGTDNGIRLLGAISLDEIQDDASTHWPLHRIDLGIADLQVESAGALRAAAVAAAPGLIVAAGCTSPLNLDPVRWLKGTEESYLADIRDLVWIHGTREETTVRVSPPRARIAADGAKPEENGQYDGNVGGSKEFYKALEIVQGSFLYAGCTQRPKRGQPAAFRRSWAIYPLSFEFQVLRPSAHERLEARERLAERYNGLQF